MIILDRWTGESILTPRVRPFSPDYLAGATRIGGVRVLIGRIAGGLGERSIVYSGLRGVGKTVPLIEFDPITREAGWATTDVHEVGTQADFRTTFSEAGYRLLRSMSRRERMKERARQAMGYRRRLRSRRPAVSRPRSTLSSRLARLTAAIPGGI